MVKAVIAKPITRKELKKFGKELLAKDRKIDNKTYVKKKKKK
jgi:hypothetical protein